MSKSHRSNQRKLISLRLYVRPSVAQQDLTNREKSKFREDVLNATGKSVNGD